jgi:hypothetical protein
MKLTTTLLLAFVGLALAHKNTPDKWDKPEYSRQRSTSGIRKVRCTHRDNCSQTDLIVVSLKRENAAKLFRILGSSRLLELCRLSTRSAAHVSRYEAKIAIHHPEKLTDNIKHPVPCRAKT